MPKFSTKFQETGSKNTLKRWYIMTKWALPQGCKNSSIYTNQSMWYTILTNWKIKKSHDHLNRCRESFQQNSTLIYNKKKKKNSPESKHRRNIPQQNKNHIWQIQNKHYSQWWKNENIFSEIRNKTRVPTLTIIIQHSFGSPSHSNKRIRRNKRNSDWERSKILTVCIYCT